ncbi:MAG: 23S rRNA (pseudouridine(1915)-N(3))-methyltransferase RlmH [Firmicutes bacterium]|nr:23S rRNA (pseudouridine(1915)-N(3))-methyltransferase RlmH [Bacillota bacterium]
MIKIICSGKLKEQYLNDLVNDYLKRINKYHKLEIVEIKDENSLEKERDSILKYINKNDYIITCDINGDLITSEKFAELIDKTFINYSTIDFVIGSSIGIHDDIKKIASKSISFSRVTFPHGFFRGLLLEQIYRAFKINNNETYHK